MKKEEKKRVLRICEMSNCQVCTELESQRGGGRTGGKVFERNNV